MTSLLNTRWKKILAFYLALLLVSHVVRVVFPRKGRVTEHEKTIPLAAINHGAHTGGDITMAFTDWGGAEADRPVVVLLHGTPMAGESFDALAPKLAPYFRVIVPDLPGFGGSTRNIPDYSIRAHAAYLVQLLDYLQVDSAHLVGYSQGGGVALEFYDLAPGRTRSVTLLSSIGVQELELLGDYHLNHALYAVQGAFLRLLALTLPHFGHLDDAYLNRAYARNFSDTDQRPLRGLLEHFEPPMLILQGRADKLVPLAAAEEHHRIVPQSELVLFDGGHGLVFSQTHLLAPRIRAFINDVEDDRALRRETASADRVARAEEPFDWRDAPKIQGLTLAIMLCLLAVATYVSEDLTCIAAGLMVARGMLDFVPATIACLVGIYTGDFLLFLAGRYLGQPAVKRAPFKWFIKEGALIRSREWFAKKGPAVILISRFIPGARLTTYVAAGILHTSFLAFSAYFLLAAILWTPLLVGASYFLGAKALVYLEAYQAWSLPVAVGLALIMLLVVKLLAPLTTFRGRRLKLSTWRRLTHWEFWPPWAFYPPIVLYVLYLGVKYRCMTLFTAANPAMPAGGFIGESKADILDGLAGAGGVMAKHALIPARRQSAVATDTEDAQGDARLDTVKSFMAGHGFSYPVVLKPDAGERGRGVVIARSDEDVRVYLAAHDVAILVQEYAPGKEFGIFYYRMPDEESGKIFAITDKEIPAVTGDGKSTLEELILRDDRAVCMARFHLAKHADHLYDVPAEGEVISLVELGTHCLGCVFLDGAWVNTPELEDTMDRISKTYDGFYFGRYDIRTPSVEEFQEGKNFKIVELNGVTSEATNIYDPRNSLLTAWRILINQWCLAFEIGDQNRATGTRPSRPGYVLAMILGAGSSQSR